MVSLGPQSLSEMGMKDVCQLSAWGNGHFSALLFSCKDSVHRWTGLGASQAACYHLFQCCGPRRCSAASALWQLAS